MAHVDEELAIRRMLAELTADQPPAPPARYAAVRRRAIVHRRRQLAGAAAAVAILVFAAIAIPLGLVHVGPTPPTTPSTRYHVSQSRPGPGSPPGLVATGIASGVHWRVSVREISDMFCDIEQFAGSPRTTQNCTDGPAPPATQLGDPLSFLSSGGSPWQLNVGYVGSDVSYLTVRYNNGQVVRVYPVSVFAARYARYFAFAAPYSAAVTQITTYGRSGELAYAIPFSGDGGIQTVRWLQPGQAAVPTAVRAQIGSGRVDGKAWHGFVDLGPWGTCFTGVGPGIECSPQIAWPLGETSSVDQIASSGSGLGFSVVFGETSPAVSALIVTTTSGRTVKVPVVSVAGRNFFTYANAGRDRVVRWRAYNAAGQRLASGAPLG